MPQPMRCCKLFMTTRAWPVVCPMVTVGTAMLTTALPAPSVVYVALFQVGFETSLLPPKHGPA
jgi:hypothetical protein